MPRSRGRIALTVVFITLGILAWAQAVLGLAHISGAPRGLVAFQAAMGAAALATAWGCWRIARWAAVAALAYGVVTASMLLSLAPMLGLPPNARQGLWSGSALVMLFALWAAWYLGGYSRSATLGSTSDARRAGK